VIRSRGCEIGDADDRDWGGGLIAERARFGAHGWEVLHREYEQQHDHCARDNDFERNHACYPRGKFRCEDRRALPRAPFEGLSQVWLALGSAVLDGCGALWPDKRVGAARGDRSYSDTSRHRAEDRLKACTWGMQAKCRLH
jgi:hypothetical protein